jgi:hypothetical protein
VRWLRPPTATERCSRVRFLSRPKLIGPVENAESCLTGNSDFKCLRKIICQLLDQVRWWFENSEFDSFACAGSTARTTPSRMASRVTPSLGVRRASVRICGHRAKVFRQFPGNSVSSAHVARTQALQTIPKHAHHGVLSSAPKEPPAMLLGDSASVSGVRDSALPLAQLELNLSRV